MALDPNRADASALPPLQPGARIAAAVSTYHRELTGAMLETARQELVRAGLDSDALEVMWVPGAFELPLAAQRLARRPEVVAVLCFGLVLSGETTHDRYIAHAAAQGLTKVGLDADKPVLFGVLTCQTLDQARARALPEDRGGTHDKGSEVARAAIDMLRALHDAPAAEAARSK